jgi:hypothetical protein
MPFGVMSSNLYERGLERVKLTHGLRDTQVIDPQQLHIEQQVHMAATNPLNTLSRSCVRWSHV